MPDVVDSAPPLTRQASESSDGLRPKFDVIGPQGVELALLSPQPYLAIMTRDGKVGGRGSGVVKTGLWLTWMCA